MASNSLNLLITGASGYIGGSVLHQMRHSNLDNIKSLNISVIVRGDAQAELFKKQGLKTYKVESLDQSDVLQQIASEHDVVIHTASGFHTGSAVALIRGLSDRKKETGKEVYYIHTSGTSNLGDRPITKQYSESRIFSDKEDIFSYLVQRESIEEYGQRTTDIAVQYTGLELSVNIYIIMAPTIYGFGTGPFNTISIQIPTFIRDMIKHGNVAVIGEGKGIWNSVHIQDLVVLYEIILNKVISGEDIPQGKSGIYFAENGEHSWWDLSHTIAQAGIKAGIIKEEEPQKLGIVEAANRLTAGQNTKVAELGFASNSRTKAVLSRELGWTPKKTTVDLKQYVYDELNYILSQEKLTSL